MYGSVSEGSWTEEWPTAPSSPYSASKAGSDLPAGVYHGTAAGRTTWYGLARETFRLSGLGPERIRPVGSERFPRPPARPTCGVLGHGNWARAGLVPLPRWDYQLTAALDTPAFAGLAAVARTSGGRPLT